MKEEQEYVYILALNHLEAQLEIWKVPDVREGKNGSIKFNGLLWPYYANTLEGIRVLAENIKNEVLENLCCEKHAEKLKAQTSYPLVDKTL